MKKVQYAILASLFILSCSHKPASVQENKEVVSESQIERDVAAESVILFKNPATGKGFWQEFTEAKAPLGNTKTAQGILKTKLRVFGTWVKGSPVAAFQDIRKNSPVLQLESLPINPKKYEFGNTYFLSKYDDVVEALSRPKELSVRNYNTKMSDSVGAYMLGSDETRYNMKEKPWMRKMLPQSDLPKVRTIVRKLVQDAIADQSYIGQDIAGRNFGRLEVVNQIARRVPLQLTGAYFGFPGPNIAKLAEWSRATQDDYFHNVKGDTGVHAAAVKATQEMHSYLTKLIAYKQQQIKNGSTADDILSRLIKDDTKEFVFPKSEEDFRVRANIIGMLVGGVETTQAAIVQSIDELLKRPQVMAAAVKAAQADDVDTVAKFVWEALRFHPVNPFVIRYAEQDVTLKNGATIPKGSHVMVGTQSAMFDEAIFPQPNAFRLDRDQNKFFHLGFGHHRCLGDYVSMIQVPEIVMAILKLPNLRRASGADGQVDFRKRTKVHMFVADDFSTSFPEKFNLEFDAPAAPADKVQLANQSYAYEDYLMTFDRHAYRVCLAGLPSNQNSFSKGQVVSAIFENLDRHNINGVTKDNRELLFCRMNSNFQTCMNAEAKAKKFTVLQMNAAHSAAFEMCKNKAGLTSTEVAFYQNVMLGKKLDATMVKTDQVKRSTGGEFAFEDYVKFYDRYSYRECFMNPAGVSSFGDRDMIMYARFNIDFRMCMGKPILAHKYSKGFLGTDRETTYEKCKNGVYNPSTMKYEGALSATEKYFYETEILKRHVNFSDLSASTK